MGLLLIYDYVFGLICKELNYLAVEIVYKLGISLYEQQPYECLLEPADCCLYLAYTTTTTLVDDLSLTYTGLTGKLSSGFELASSVTLSVFLLY